MKVLTRDQIGAYETDGYLLLERFVDRHWLDRLNAAMDEFIEASRQLTDSSSVVSAEGFVNESISPRYEVLTSSLLTISSLEPLQRTRPLLITYVRSVICRISRAAWSVIKMAIPRWLRSRMIS